MFFQYKKINAVYSNEQYLNKKNGNKALHNSIEVCHW